MHSNFTSKPMDLVYRDARGFLHRQPWQDVTTVGTLIDPEDGEDMEMVGWWSEPEPNTADSENETTETFELHPDVVTTDWHLVPEGYVIPFGEIYMIVWDDGLLQFGVVEDNTYPLTRKGWRVSYEEDGGPVYVFHLDALLPPT